MRVEVLDHKKSTALGKVAGCRNTEEAAACGSATADIGSVTAAALGVGIAKVKAY